MQAPYRIGRFLMIFSAFGMLVAPVAHGAGPGAGRQPAVVRDVALLPDGSLHGQVVNPQGKAASQVAVQFGRLDLAPQTTVTGLDGRFAVQGLRPGIYQFQTATGSGVYRVWAPHTAPPAAHAGVVLVEQETIILGQNGTAWGYIANPWVMGLIAAAAIAIPLALDNGS
jgi:hypothetical protein